MPIVKSKSKGWTRGWTRQCPLSSPLFIYFGVKGLTVKKLTTKLPSSQFSLSESISAASIFLHQFHHSSQFSLSESISAASSIFFHQSHLLYQLSLSIPNFSLCLSHSVISNSLSLKIFRILSHDLPQSLPVSFFLMQSLCLLQSP